MDNNQKGEVGEKYVEFCLADSGLFRVKFLGEKWPCLDFYVELTDTPNLVHFFLQVKSTERGYTKKEQKLNITVKEEHINYCVDSVPPIYIIGVSLEKDTHNKSSHKAFILYPTIKEKLLSMPTNFELNRENLRILYNEVLLFWQNLSSFTSNFSI